jgi:hypothetical protein
MSLWLQSYNGYDGSMNCINEGDEPSVRISKVHHILVHLGMDIFERMNNETKRDFINAAKEQIDIASIPGLECSIHDLWALPLIKLDLRELDIFEILEMGREQFKRKLESCKPSTRNDDSRMKYLGSIPRNLNLRNIEKAIVDYEALVNEMPDYVQGGNGFLLLEKLKRDNLTIGPYPGVSLFEAANRILTDIVILKGVQILLNGEIPGIDYEEYFVEYGNENRQGNDIIADNGKNRLRGEAFNVATSLFNWKNRKTVKKLLGSKEECEHLIVVYNSDARNIKDVYTLANGIIYIPVTR